MRDELLAKQQELMKLQQQRLELELEETRRALMEKEKMVILLKFVFLHIKEQFDCIFFDTIFS
jgi:hypothetical protein